MGRARVFKFPVSEATTFAYSKIMPLDVNNTLRQPLTALDVKLLQDIINTYSYFLDLLCHGSVTNRLCITLVHAPHFAGLGFSYITDEMYSRSRFTNSFYKDHNINILGFPNHIVSCNYSVLLFQWPIALDSEKNRYGYIPIKLYVRKQAKG